MAAKAVGGMCFHDLRHAHATWLVTDGVPINLVQQVMGHEQASTTLNRYTHTPADYAARILDAFTLPADNLLTTAPEPPSESLPDSMGKSLRPAVERSPREGTTPIGGMRTKAIDRWRFVAAGRLRTGATERCLTFGINPERGLRCLLAASLRPDKGLE